jgi:hypothetical protein
MRLMKNNVLLNLVIYYIEDTLNNNLKILLVQYQYYLLINFALFIYLLYEFLSKNIDIIYLRLVFAIALYSVMIFLGLCRDDVIIAI